ncbi:acyltransferase family protein [Candidatus Poriferisocius sp.]|uniref:acyltransferase family protein n=1 Tax=Candidatus Poriferisocius sp. TaxID=3101276 RepID=UPI003B51F00C
MRYRRVICASKAALGGAIQRVPALDGLRAAAIAVVVVYHIDSAVLPAGHYSVTLFFVLSGYVVTGSLCAEMDRTGRVDLGSFYRRRVLRLVPALLAVCLAMVAVGIGWSRLIAVLGFYANYARIEGLDLERLTHTWFIAVIVHFYLLWPLAIAGLRARHRTLVVGGLALAAIAWRATAIEVMSPGWVYNATDTNAAALLVGCYLAVAQPTPWRFAKWSVPALLALMLVPAFDVTGTTIFWGGFLALALSALTVQYALTGPVWLANSVLLRVAEMSFGLYLWHYVLIRSDIALWLALALTFAATAASWYLLERPVLRWAARRKSQARTLPALSA